MPIFSIDHVQIAMPPGQEDQARAFYVGILGFTEIPKPAGLAKRGGAWFQSDGVQLHLGVDADFRPARKAHPAFIVSGLDSLVAKIQAAGYKTDTSQPPLDEYKRAHVFDPFGNRIELMEKS
jgi:catechol 2,3-dioxygenase-like lactoylglutathione lyase family enzyme